MSGKATREEVEGSHSCDQDYVLYRCGNVIVKPTIVYNYYMIVKLNEK